MAKLTISIVNYNAGDYLIECLESIKKTKGDLSIEVYIVDNDSSDDSFEKAKKKFPEYSYIKNDSNEGFGRAHNQVLKINKSEYILILNPDVELPGGVLSGMIEFMEADQTIGAATPGVILSNNQVDLTAHRGFPTPWASFKYYFLKDDSDYHLSKSDFSGPHEVDAISGAFFLTKKSVLDKTGFFDEDYFMYAEDIDLCFRIKKMGFKVMYNPLLKVLHHKGVSSGLKKLTQGVSSATLETKKRSLDAFYQTMEIFYRKHLARDYPFFINWLVYFGINLKWRLAKKNLTV